MRKPAFTRRGFLRAAAVGAAGSLLAACGATPTPQVIKEVVTQVVEKEVTVEVPVEVTSEVEVVVTATAAPVEPVELVIWDPIFDPQQVLLKELFPKYTDMHPNVTFKYESIQYDEVHKKVTIAMAGGGGPDAFNVPSYTWARFIENSSVLEIDPVSFGVASLADLEARYVPNLLNAFKVSGKLMVVPTYVGAYIPAYNPVLFPNGWPETWEDLIAVSKDITKADASGNFTAVTMLFDVNNPEHVHADMGPFIWEKGGDLLNADRTKCTINEPAAVEGVAMMRRMVDEQVWVPGFPFSNDAFFAGQVAAIVNGDWTLGEWDGISTERNLPKIQLGAFPAMAPGESTQNYLQPWGWLVNSATIHPAETWNLIGYLMNLENAERWMKETSQYTGVLAAWVQEIEQNDPRMKLSWEQLSYSHIGLISSRYDEIMQVIVQASEAIMLENAAIQETLDAAAANVDAILATPA